MSADGLPFLWLNKKGSKEVSLRGKGPLRSISPLKIPLWGVPFGPAMKGWQNGDGWGDSIQVRIFRLISLSSPISNMDWRK